MSGDCRTSWAKNSPAWSLHTTLSLAWPSSAQLFPIIKLEHYSGVGLVIINVKRVEHVIGMSSVLLLWLFNVFLIVGCVPVPKIPAGPHKRRLGLLCCWNQSGNFGMWGVEKFPFGLLFVIILLVIHLTKSLTVNGKLLPFVYVCTTNVQCLVFFPENK